MLGIEVVHVVLIAMVLTGATVVVVGCVQFLLAGIHVLPSPSSALLTHATAASGRSNSIATSANTSSSSTNRIRGSGEEASCGSSGDGGDTLLTVFQDSLMRVGRVSEFDRRLRAENYVLKEKSRRGDSNPGPPPYHGGAPPGHFTC
jgi:hypothetical protein